MSHTYNELETKINRTCKRWITIHHPEQQPEDLHINMKKGVVSRSQMPRRTESLQILKNLKYLDQAFGTGNVVVDIDRGEVPQPIGCSARELLFTNFDRNARHVFSHNQRSVKVIASQAKEIYNEFIETSLCEQLIEVWHRWYWGLGVIQNPVCRYSR